jgi:hypothetical protein
MDVARAQECPSNAVVMRLHPDLRQPFEEAFSGFDCVVRIL